MDKVSFPYRSSSHLVLLHVVAESGAWEKYGLDVNYDYKISSTEAHRAVPLGEVEFVGGNHVSTYGRRARGDSWVYLGQALNQVNHQLVVRPDGEINGLADLHGRKVGTHGNHPSLNDWLFLKQHGLDSTVTTSSSSSIPRKGIEAPVPRPRRRRGSGTWCATARSTRRCWRRPQPVRASHRPQGHRRRAAAMIHFTTISSSLGFVEKHPDIVERFLKGLIEGIHFFKTKPDQAIRIICRNPGNAAR